MSAANKTLQAMRRSPRADWRIEDLRVVALRNGISVREGRGSHVVFAHPRLPTLLTVPARRPIKAPYVREFVRMIDAVLAEEFQS